MLDVANEMVLCAALAMRGVVKVVGGRGEGIHFELQIVIGKIDGRPQGGPRKDKSDES